MENWFTVDPIARDTYAISEYRHWEETHSYLLIGSTSALLIDTGLGVCDLSRVTDQLTDKPILAAATHVHWDHIGSHGSFAEIAVHEAEESWLRKFPLPLQQVRSDLQKNGHSFPEGFDPDQYTPFEGKATRILRDDDVIDLGDRQIEVLHTPGHALGHICFYERARGWLWSGDLLYKGTLYAFYPSTDPVQFYRSVERVAQLPVTRLFPGHHSPFVTPELIGQTLEAFRTLEAAGKLHQGSGVHTFPEITIHI